MLNPSSSYLFKSIVKPNRVRHLLSIKNCRRPGGTIRAGGGLGDFGVGPKENVIPQQDTPKMAAKNTLQLDFGPCFLNWRAARAVLRIAGRPFREPRSEML